MEVSQLDLKNQQKSFQDKEREEEEQKPLKEEEWICESCNKLNIMTNDMKSSLCVKCHKKNEVVEYMIHAKGGQESKIQKEYFDHYNNNKSKGKV
tara:strand:+ start:2262 stop:2546 length:285 start_codon:yes stop_codon:yes gene_type:complete